VRSTVFECVPERMMAADPARHGLGELLAGRAPGTRVVRLDRAPADVDRLIAETNGDRPVLVLRDAHRHAWQRPVAERLLAAFPATVIVDVGYPSWRPEHAAAYVTTFGTGRANLAAAADVLVSA